MRTNLFLFIIWFWFILATIVGCKSQSMVVVEPTVHNRDSVCIEYIYKLDSIYKDRWHVILQKGDTIYRTDSIVIYEFRNIEVHDTISVQHTDTITIRETVEKQISGGSKFLIWSGAIMWGIIGLVVIAIIIAIVIRFSK